MDTLRNATCKGDRITNGRGQHTTVLVAAVDAISPPRPLDRPRSGISFLYGGSSPLLPSVRAREGCQDGDGDDMPSISILLNPLSAAMTPLTLTLPIANTVFQNGTQTTMFAEQWCWDSAAPAKVVQRSSKSSQVIVARSEDGATSTISVPLVPITPPRRILTGLGNIVREVEIEGQASSASQELEANIPELLARRQRAGGEQMIGPIGVWALVIPEGVFAARNLPQFDLARAVSATPDQMYDVSSLFTNLMASGCRLHKICTSAPTPFQWHSPNSCGFVVSGGGGWGLKKGLLSLDPQTRYSAPGQGDVESFIKSFHGQNSEDGNVRPGAYIQFFVEPALAPAQPAIRNKPLELGSETSTSLVFGTAPAGLEDAELHSGDSIEAIPGHFGALSTNGFFIDSTQQRFLGASDPSKAMPTLLTKIDAPNSYICGWT